MGATQGNISPAVERPTRLVATNKLGGRVEYDGEYLRMLDVRIRDKRPVGYLEPIAVASVFDVEWREAGTWMQGWLHFAYPGGKRYGGYMHRWNDGTCYFWPKESDQFRAVRDAVLEIVNEGRSRIEAAISLARPGARLPFTTPGAPGLLGYRGLQAADVSSHYDTTTAGQVTGTLEHSLRGSFAATGFAVDLGLIDSVTAGSMRISGSSTLDLITRSTSRHDLLNQAFVAVFEMPRTRETVRLIAPADAVCREAIRTVVGEASGHVDPAELPERRAAELAESLTGRILIETTLAFDRLNALLRAPVASRPAVELIGLPVAPGTLLGGALRIAGEQRWLQLFPLGLLRALEDPNSVDNVQQEDENWWNDAGTGPELVQSPPAVAGDAPQEASVPSATKVCPQCAEEVKAAALICRYCRYEFVPVPPSGS